MSNIDPIDLEAFKQELARGFWTAPQLAKRFNVTRQTIYHWHKLGLLPSSANKGGKTMLFTAEDVAVFLSTGADLTRKGVEQSQDAATSDN